jgi:nucleoside-diphosphate kinase
MGFNWVKVIGIGIGTACLFWANLFSQSAFKATFQSIRTPKIFSVIDPSASSSSTTPFGEKAKSTATEGERKNFDSISEKSGWVRDTEKKTTKAIKMETTLIILKPDCMEKGLSGEIIHRFNKANFKIVGCKMILLGENLLREHYAHLIHLPFFHEIVTFMQSQPVMVIALQGERAIEKVRDLLGPTDSAIAPKGTIRGDYGTDKMRNIAHASDSEVSAQCELKRFFKPEELFLF